MLYACSKKAFSFLLIPVVVVALIGCEVPDPAPNQVIPTDWGAGVNPTYRDVPYVPGAYRGCLGWGDDQGCGGSQMLDIYPAVLGGSKGTLVFVHGGGFINNDKFPLSDIGIIRRLTHTGWSVVSVNYRLVRRPEFAFPVGIQDVNAALRWVRANSVNYGLNTERLVVTGHSAGGTLAMLAGVGGNSGRSEFGETPPLSGWVSMAGIANFKAGPMSEYWGRLWVGNDKFNQLWQIASPLTWWDAADPKGYIAHGDLDTFVEYANATQLYNVSRESERVHFDSVDRWADGSFMTGSLRGHMPPGGMNATEFQVWLDGLPTLHWSANPFGSLDAVTVAVDGKVAVKGWALDPDTTLPVPVHLYVNKGFGASLVANTPRADVGRAHPLHGPNHGFVATLSLPTGAHNVCAYAINIGPGNNNPAFGCRNVTVP